ncbi:hypothetical protein KC356_g8962 [Hortaea werneckii]|nr:hypothetical protein KC356_g8962 [Hortaea werneckii]KAI7722685.1 hypothetical protein KC353_g283 [Hortaea werneckii]
MPEDPRLPSSDQRSFGGAITTLTVGEKGTEYKVHEAFLCENSAFFASASKAEWKEDEEHRVPLPDDDPSVVDMYVNWLYTGKIFCRHSQDERRTSEYKLLISGYEFGEKVQDDGFRNAVVDSLIHAAATPNKAGQCWYPGLSMVDKAYKATPEGSPLRRLITTFYLNCGNDNWLRGDMNREFLTDLTKCLLRDKKASGQKSPTLPNISSCQYHHHSKGERCYS